MAKGPKRSKAAPAAEADNARSVEVGQASETDSALAASMAAVLGYSESTWKALPNYICNCCPYATINLDGMREHVAGHKARDAADLRSMRGVGVSDNPDAQEG